MMFQTLHYRKTDHVIIIDIIDQLADPSKLIQLSDELTELCSEIAWDEEIRVVLITDAEGKSFSMDVDVISLGLRDNEELKINALNLAESIAKLDKPIIAAINGDALGQGLELALACDLRIATETSHFGLPHIRMGLIPWDGGTQRLSRLVGRGKALEMILTGEMIDAKEAYRIGLVNKIVPSGELRTIVMDMAKEMASKGPISLRYTKEAVNKGMDMTLEQGLHLEADLYLLLHTTKDRTEGIQAFRGKKTPQFEGK
jgi:enoyl-CoA hydratase